MLSRLLRWYLPEVDILRQRRNWSPSEENRLKKGEDVNNLLRERMKDAFLKYFLTDRGQEKDFNFHQEDFPEYNRLRKYENWNGRAYDNY